MDEVCLFRSCFPPSSRWEDVEKFFEEWAKTYDQDLHPETNWPAVINVVEMFVKCCNNNKNIKIVDVGAGTGMVALELIKHGFTNIDALDGCRNMLEKAKKKNLYKEYICDVVTAEKRLDYIATGTYDALISCGTITGGYIKAEAFDEILRLVKNGGYICFTIRKNIYDEDSVYGYATKFEELQKCCKWEELSREVSDYCYGSLDVDKECYICCYKVLKNE